MPSLLCFFASKWNGLKLLVVLKLCQISEVLMRTVYECYSALLWQTVLSHFCMKQLLRSGYEKD